MDTDRPVPDDLDPSSIETFYDALEYIRNAMIQRLGDDFLTKGQIIGELFGSLDTDSDGVLTTEELQEFLKSPELGLLDQVDTPDAERYAKLFADHIDQNRNGVISLQELKDFIFPEHSGSAAMPATQEQVQMPTENRNKDNTLHAQKNEEPFNESLPDEEVESTNVISSTHSTDHANTERHKRVREFEAERPPSSLGLMISTPAIEETDHHKAEPVETISHGLPNINLIPRGTRDLPPNLSPTSSFQGSVLSFEGQDCITSLIKPTSSKSPGGNNKHSPSHLGHSFSLKSSRNLVGNMSAYSLQSSGNSSYGLNAPSVVSSYATSYNKLVQRLRDKLFSLATDGDSEYQNYPRKFILTNIFRIIDDNDSGVVTKDELQSFLTSPQLDLFPDSHDPTNQKFLNLLMEQIDAHRDGNIRMEELETFLWPKTTSPVKGDATQGATSHEPHYESGVIVDLTRKALLQALGSAAAQGPDEVLAEFAKMSKTGWKRGKQIDSRTTKKALQHVYIQEFQRLLNEEEVEMLMISLDQNNDGVVSGREFMTWLIPSSAGDEKNVLANELRRIVMEKFGGDVRRMFEAFKSYGAEVIYKADFMTNLRALDSSLTRHVVQDMASMLCQNHEKSITFGKLSDFVGNINFPISRLNSTEMDEENDLGETIHVVEDFNVVDEGVGGVAAGKGTGASVSPRTASPQKANEVKLSNEELDEARALLAKNREATRSREDTVSIQGTVAASKTLNNEQRNFKSGDMDSQPQSPPRQYRQPRPTVGLNPQQLLALGYFKHTGRWRGFPFDSFSCCNTADFICPNSNKFLPAAKDSEKRGFIVSQRIQPSAFSAMSSSVTLDTKKKFVLKKPSKSAQPQATKSSENNRYRHTSSVDTFKGIKNPPKVHISSKVKPPEQPEPPRPSSYEKALMSLQQEFQQFKEISIQTQWKLSSRLQNSEQINSELRKEMHALRSSSVSIPRLPLHRNLINLTSTRSLSPSLRKNIEDKADLAVPWIPSSGDARSPSFNRIYFSAYPKHQHPKSKHQRRSKTSSPTPAYSMLRLPRRKSSLPQKMVMDKDNSTTVVINGQVVQQSATNRSSAVPALSEDSRVHELQSPKSMDVDFFRHKSFDEYSSPEEKSSFREYRKPEYASQYETLFDDDVSKLVELLSESVRNTFPIADNNTMVRKEE